MPKNDVPFDFDGFDGFELPTTTPTPDIIFDRLLHVLKEAELKALLYIVRRTYGFKKSADAISFSQFQNGITTSTGKVLDYGCGVRDRTTLSKALQSLETMGIIASEKHKDESTKQRFTTVYRLRFRVVGNSYQGGMNRPQGAVGNSYLQEPVNKNTYNKKRETPSYDDWTRTADAIPPSEWLGEDGDD